MCPKSTPIYVTHIILHPKTKLQESKSQIEEISNSVHEYRTMVCIKFCENIGITMKNLSPLQTASAMQRRVQNKFLSSEWLTADKHLLSDVSQRPFPQVQVQTINSVAQVHHLVSNDKQLNITSLMNMPTKKMKIV